MASRAVRLAWAVRPAAPEAYSILNEKPAGGQLAVGGSRPALQAAAEPPGMARGFARSRPAGQAHVFWQGPRFPGCAAGPAVAAGPSGRLAVFWRGRGQDLWFGSQSGGTEWDAPRNLGGGVA